MRVRLFTRGDIPFGMQLKAAAGWNQTPDDWERLLALRPDGCFVAEWEGKPAGTVTTTVHGGAVGWIGMLLVVPELRGRGIGTRLLDAAIASLPSCRAVKLDATPAGRKVYLPRGFVEETVLERRVRESRQPERQARLKVQPGTRIEPISLERLTSIAAYDAGIFGVDRRPVLEGWLRGAPHLAFAAHENDRLLGYCLGRKGSRCDQLGPLVADDCGVARRLLERALASLGGRPVILDAFTGSAAWLRHLDELELRVERGFSRMCLGSGAPRGQLAPQWAIAGPEVG